MRRLAPFAVLLIPIAVAIASACGQDRLERASDDVSVVSGTPSVNTGLPGVSRTVLPDGGIVFGSAAPYQVDSFSQQTVQQVDILWIIDNSSSMDQKQARVKANFVSFMQFLVQQQIDFHLGVVTTDIYDPTQSGRLVNLAGLSHPWIASSDSAAAADFVLNASVGTKGSGDEKPLLAGMLALTAPLSPATPTSPDAGAANCANLSDGGVECFLRPNAPLYTIVLSDEEDSSCSPILADTEGCNDAQAAMSGYGAIDYWSRFYAGARGTNVSSRLAAIVANDDTVNDCASVFAHDCDQFGLGSGGSACSGTNPDCQLPMNLANPCCTALSQCYADIQSKAQWCAANFQFVLNSANQTISPFYTLSGSWPGCVSYGNDGGVDFTAFSADRSTAVAVATGGVATSICQSDYTPALANLGLQAAGLRTQFPLSRAPIAGSVTVTVGGVAVTSSATTWQYVACSGTAPGSTPANVVQFATPPAAGTKVVVSYYVNVRGLGACP